MRGVLHAAGVLLLIAPLVAGTAYREGPLPAMTGGFGEQSCRACHLDHPENPPGGSLRVTGVPALYTPGREYPITVTLTRPGLAVGGFEMTSRFASGPRTGRQAGRLRAPDARTRIVYAEDGLVQYIQHTRLGSAARAGQARWTVFWTAPAAATGPVAFHAAANASNDDSSPLGDFIYTTVVSSRAGR